MAMISTVFNRQLSTLPVTSRNLKPCDGKRRFDLRLVALLHSWLNSAFLLNFFGFDDQLRKTPAQTFSDGLSRIQIWASLSAFQKPNIGLVQTSFFRQSRPAQPPGFTAFLHDRGETVG